MTSCFVSIQVATQPTEYSLRESRREHTRQGALRKDAICRQIADSLVREICASEAQGIIAEIEAQYASSGAFVSKAIASAVISRLDGAAKNELSFWEPEPDETPEQKARRKKLEKERRAREKKAAKGGLFGGKKKVAPDDDDKVRLFLIIARAIRMTTTVLLVDRLGANRRRRRATDPTTRTSSLIEARWTTASRTRWRLSGPRLPPTKTTRLE